MCPYCSTPFFCIPSSSVEPPEAVNKQPRMSRPASGVKVFFELADSDALHVSGIFSGISPCANDDFRAMCPNQGNGIECLAGLRGFT